MIYYNIGVKWLFTVILCYFIDQENRVHSKSHGKLVSTTLGVEFNQN